MTDNPLHLIGKRVERYYKKNGKPIAKGMVVALFPNGDIAVRVTWGDTKKTQRWRKDDRWGIVEA